VTSNRPSSRSRHLRPHLSGAAAATRPAAVRTQATEGTDHPHFETRAPGQKARGSNTPQPSHGGSSMGYQPGSQPTPHQPHRTPGHTRRAYPNDPTIRGRGRSGRPWERAKHLVYREETHCWLCHQPVDQTLDQRHRMARTVDHLVQLTHGGPHLARTNHRLAHRSCNSIRGNKLKRVNREHCACTQGQPCAPLTTANRELVVDARTI
jgi:hypothetical protein